VCFSLLFHVIQCLSVDQLYKEQLAELPAILDRFYTTITNDHMGMEVRDGGEPWKWQIFPCILKLTLLEGFT